MALKQLNLTDAAHFYNLASLEATLLALMHITARYKHILHHLQQLTDKTKDTELVSFFTLHNLFLPLGLTFKSKA